MIRLIRQRLRLEYRLSFATGWHCGSGLPRGLTDRAVLLDAQEQPYVPGSTVKGIVREQCEDLVQTLLAGNARRPYDDAADRAALRQHALDPIEAIFGTRLRPGRLAFDDCRLPTERRDEPDDDSPLTAQQQEERARALARLLVGTRTQVSLSRLFGRAEDGRLFTSEAGRAGLDLNGRIVGVLAGLDLGEVDDRYQGATSSLLVLLAGLLLTDRLGGGRSAGHGAAGVSIEALRLDGVAVAPEKFAGWLDEEGLYALELAWGEVA